MTMPLGMVLWNQAATWAEFADGARRAEALGYDHVWTWDHLYGIEGDPYQATWDGYTALAGLAGVTSRVRLGLFVGAVTFRNPFVVAKSLTTLDHLSGGRAIAGLGAAWFDLEHEAAGIDFGRSVGERLDWLDEATSALRTLFAGGWVTSAPDAHYRFSDLVLLPPPVQRRLPIMIGGGGLTKTLRIVARYADMWNTSGSVERLTAQVAALREHCEAIGRPFSEIELTCGCHPVIRSSEREARAAWLEMLERNRLPAADAEDVVTWWVGTPELIADRIRERAALGFSTFMAEIPAPFDPETMERLIGEVRPMVEAG
jgi:alkanesulfonate monooxygenase SsuD/methylene tetrahydromethanopterin reductase-like flavin-dependent oxidoreductase (luciferase family)